MGRRVMPTYLFQHIPENANRALLGWTVRPRLWNNSTVYSSFDTSTHLHSKSECSFDVAHFIIACEFSNQTFSNHLRVFFQFDCSSIACQGGARGAPTSYKMHANCYPNSCPSTSIGEL